MRRIDRQGDAEVDGTAEEPDPEEVERETTPDEAEPQHSEAEANEQKEEIPSWQLRR